MVKLAHLVNPYETNDPESKKIQEITLQSMLDAKRFSQNVDVKLCATVLLSEKLDLDPDFNVLDLQQTVLDIGTFKKKIPYALIGEIIAKAKDIDCDYIVYTNMDIILQPYFYDYISKELEKGFKGLLINRRRVSMKYLEEGNLAQILADPGKYHPGYDCFVIEKSYLDKFILKDICGGIPFIGVSMAHNVFSFVHPYKIISKHHLTAHIGLQVMGGRSKEYYQHNFMAFQKIRSQLKPYLKKENLPFSELSLFKRIISWGLNPSTPILLNLEVEGKGFFNKLYFYWNELRFKILGDISS